MAERNRKLIEASQYLSDNFSSILVGKVASGFVGSNPGTRSGLIGVERNEFLLRSVEELGQ
jgi:hypothetical protein